MIRTAEAVIDEHGTVRHLEPVEVGGVRRALVTIPDEEPTSLTREAAIVSERSLAEDWNRPGGGRRVVSPSSGSAVLVS
jgi:hypothetical protein